MPDPGMGPGAVTDGGVQQAARLRLIIHVIGFPAHMQVGAFVGQGCACAENSLVTSHLDVR